MKIPGKIKIALIKPPLKGHLYRGTGSYFRNLETALQKVRGFELTPVNPGHPLGQFDLVHFPYFDPFFLTMPFTGKKPFVVTVHDLIPLKYPRYFPKGVRGFFKWSIQRNNLRRAKMIITDSHASREDIKKIIDFPVDKIAVVYLGVDTNFGKSGDSSTLQQVIKKYQLPEKYVLHVGDVNYNKNIPALLKIYDGIRKSDSSFSLVLVGSGFVDQSPQLKEIETYIDGLGLTDKIKRIARIETKDLVAIYNLAQLYLQPSIDEGFGLPVIEAMACHVPVVCSNRGSLPEIAGNAAVFIDPENISEAVKQINKLLTDKARINELVNRGILRSQKFRWHETAVKTAAVYKKSLGIKSYQI